MFVSIRAISLSCCVSVALVLASGCGMSTGSSSSSTTAPFTLISGKLHGGQAPVSGASIQLYATNTTTTQGASTALLTQPVTSAADGTFSITGLYSCPASDPFVYLVATGGNPGLSGSVNNTAIAMMALITDCRTLLANASTTFINIDELTTVVAVQALAPFMTDYAHVGSAPTSTSGIAQAYDTANDYVTYSNGQLYNGQNSQSLPELTYNTMADIIAACINSSGSTGSNTPCGTLFANTGGTSNTIAAALQIAKAPGQNTSQLYGIITPNPPFQPVFTSVPSDLTVTVGYTLPGFVRGAALASNGRIWLYFGGYNYDPSTDISTDSPGYIAVYDTNFNQLFTVLPGTGGLYYPTSFGRDINGHVFAINANNTVSEFDTNGAALSPAAGWPIGVASTFTPTASGDGYASTDDEADSINVDALGNIWGGISASSTGGNCYYELNSSGVIITPAGNYCATTGTDDLSTDALDGVGADWNAGSSAITKVDASGNLAATAPNSLGCFYPDSVAFSGSSSSLAGQIYTQDLLYDHTHNQVWGYSFLGAGTITDAGAAVFCDYGSSVLPVIPRYATSPATVGGSYSAGSRLLTSETLDGAGNLWFVTGGVTATGVVTATGPTAFNGSASYSFYLGEISSSGALLTPYNASNQSYGLQPTGFGPNVTASVSNASVQNASEAVSLLGIDNSGNIWAFDSESYKIFKITGLAAANAVNY